MESEGISSENVTTANAASQKVTEIENYELDSSKLQETDSEAIMNVVEGKATINDTSIQDQNPVRDNQSYQTIDSANLNQESPSQSQEPTNGQELSQKPSSSEPTITRGLSASDLESPFPKFDQYNLQDHLQAQHQEINRKFDEAQHELSLAVDEVIERIEAALNSGFQKYHALNYFNSRSTREAELELDGSLVNPQSRLRSLPPSKQTNLSLPVYVTNFHRSWSYNCNNNYTAVGVNRVTDPNSLVNGVLVELQNPASDLASLDLRERDYTRTPVNIKNIFMENSHQSDSKLNLIPIDFSDFENCVIWIYENPSERETDLDSLELFAPTPNVPIPQSYIDCIVHGCLLYSTKFAEQFVKLTSGWHHAGNGCWVDDRNSEAAKYKRRPEVGETHAPDCDAIDTVLNNVLGNVFKRRRKFSV
ncbi:hypothetical protein HK098_008088 [Nowakowskiella sp. JEL0407]|nr:hypothetical protein HK098_008088 [Nowakowskiella sp. JEL0407]